MREDSSPSAPRWRKRLLELVRRINHPLLPAFIALVVGWALVDGELNERQGDWSTLITAGDQFIDPDAVPHPISVAEGSGYDGQFFYRLALDPWTPERRELGGVLDAPPWRHQRILYPLATWLVALGNPRHVPEALVLVNLLAIALIGSAGGVIARNFDLHAIWGVVPALYPGFFLTLVRDTAEIVAAACVLNGIAALIYHEKGRAWGAAGATLMFSLAVLARETTVLVAAALFASWFWSRIRHTETVVSWHQGIVPPLVMALWHFTLYLRWGEFPSEQGSGNVGAPFVGVMEFALEIADRQNRWESVWLIELWFLAAIALLTLGVLWWSRAELYVKISYVGYFGLAAVLTRLIWVEDWSFMRALTELHMMAAIILLGAPRWARITGVIIWIAFARWMFVEIDVIR